MFTYHESGSRQWLALVSDQRMLVVDRAAAEHVARLWRIVSRKRLGEVLFAVTGSDVLAAPPFALVDWAGELDRGAVMRVFVRGPLAVTVTDSSDGVALRGDGMLTWQERVVESATGVSIVTPEGDAQAHDELPLQAGACWASSVSAVALEPATSALELGGLGAAAVEPVLVSAGGESPTDATARAPQASSRRARRAQTAATVGLVEPRFTFSVSGAAPQPLTDVVVLGRLPAASAAIGTDDPRLVAVDAPQSDLSRSHVQFCVEGDTIVVIDLDSRNGTRVVEPGRAPRPVEAAEPTVVAAGSVLELGESVTIAFDRGTPD